MNPDDAPRLDAPAAHPADLARAEAAVTEATRAVEAERGAQLAEAGASIEADYRKHACALG